MRLLLPWALLLPHASLPAVVDVGIHVLVDLSREVSNSQDQGTGFVVHV